MRRRFYSGLAGIALYYILSFLIYLVAARMFNAYMNEDVDAFVSSFQNAHSESERAEALRAVLLATKRNTASLVGTVNHVLSAAVFGFMFVVSAKWSTREARDRKDDASGQDPSSKDGTKAE